MYKYHVIIAHDDNTIYRTYSFDTKKETQQFALNWVDSAFVVCIVSDDVMKYGDHPLIKKARKHIHTNSRGN